MGMCFCWQVNFGGWKVWGGVKACTVLYRIKRLGRMACYKEQRVIWKGCRSSKMSPNIIIKAEMKYLLCVWGIELN